MVFLLLLLAAISSPSHPIEAKKDVPGTHAQGIAADIKVTNAAQRYTIIKKALSMGFCGVGVASNFYSRRYTGNSACNLDLLNMLTIVGAKHCL